MLDDIELAMAHKIAKIFNIAADQQDNPYFFIKEFIGSETFDNLFTFLPGEIAQSPSCEYNTFLREIERKGRNIPKLEKAIKYDYMFWMGYLLTYWGYMDEIHPAKLINSYDIVKIIGAYETLHTMKTSAVIEFIKKESNYIIQ